MSKRNPAPAGNYRVIQCDKDGNFKAAYIVPPKMRREYVCTGQLIDPNKFKVGDIIWLEGEKKEKNRRT